MGDKRMRLTMKERKSVTRAIASRYQKVSKKQKGTILDEFTQLTGYTRCYASYLLGNYGKRVRISSNVVVVGDVRKRKRREIGLLYTTVEFWMHLRRYGSLWTASVARD